MGRVATQAKGASVQTGDIGKRRESASRGYLVKGAVVWDGLHCSPGGEAVTYLNKGLQGEEVKGRMWKGRMWKGRMWKGRMSKGRMWKERRWWGRKWKER
jgi:hypothetical protein